MLTRILVCLLAATAWGISLWGSDAGEGRSLLVLGRTFFGGQINIDEQVKARLNGLGIQIGFGLYSEMDWRRMSRFDGLVLLAQPLPATPEYEGFERCLPLFNRFLASGGGILVYRDQTSGGAGDTVASNRLLEPLGLRMREGDFLDEKDPTRIHWWDFELRAFRGDVVGQGHPLTAGLGEIWYPRQTVSLEMGAGWTPLLMGSPTAVSRAGHSAPVLVAAGEIAGGRIVVVPSVSPCSFVDGFGPKWDGFLYNSGDGWTFFRRIVAWIGAGPRGADRPGGFTETQQQEVFPLARLEEYHDVKRLPRERQGCYGRPIKCLIGPRVTPERIADLAVAAQSTGYGVVIPVAEGHAELKALMGACEQASNDNILLFPGMQIGDPFGNQGIAVGGSIASAGWPPPGWKERSFLAANVGAGAMTIWETAKGNRTSPEVVGSISAMEVVGYDSTGDESRQGMDLLRHLNRHDWFLAPVVVDRLADPGRLKGRDGYATYIRADSLAVVRAALTRGNNVGLSRAELAKPLSQRLFPAFVSNGPLIESFHWRGDNLVYDMWEGEYYMWTGPGDQATIDIAVSSGAAVREVRLYEDGQPIRVYRGEGVSLARTFVRRSDHAARNYWIEVLDAAGRTAISSVLRSRPVGYWAHGGADRMQTYSSLMVPNEKGNWPILGQRYDFISSTYFGLGWSNNLEKAIPPFQARLMATRGIETGGPKGGLTKWLLPPFLSYVVQEEGGSQHSKMAEIGRAGYELAGADCAVLVDRGLRHVFRRNKGSDAIELIPVRSHTLSTRYSTYRYREQTFDALLMESVLGCTADGARRPDAIQAFRLHFKEGARSVSKTMVISEAGGAVRLVDIDWSRKKGLEVAGFVGRGGYAGLTHDPRSGDAAIYVQDGNRYRVSIDYAGPALVFDLMVGDGRLDKVASNLVLVYTAGAANARGEYFAEIKDFLSDCARNVVVERGRRDGAGYPLRVAADQGGIRLNRVRPEGTQLVPVAVGGLNPCISTCLVDGDGFRVMGSLADQAHVVIDARQPGSVFIGNPVWCDVPGVVVDLGAHSPDGSWGGIIHNPYPEKRLVQLGQCWQPVALRLELAPGEERSIVIPLAR